MLARLVLTDVRNHARLTLEPGPGFVVLTGPNGAGKTNILEAVSLLAPGRGLRRAALSAIARIGGPGGFGIAAELADGTALATGTQEQAPERRIVRVNGAAQAAGALAERVTLLWLTPAMDRLFVEPASERRRFLDRLTLALEPGHAHHAARYEAAMRARNRLLGDELPPDPEWLGALEAAMVEHGARIVAARRDAVDRLNERLAGAPGGFARAGLAIDGGEEDDLVRALAAGRRRDAAAGRTLAGPHRSDLVVTHLDKLQAAALCSTGEQKALLFGIVLAHAALVADRTTRPPVLLLDEVAAHLDPSRRAALFAALAGVGQVWMTGTEPTLFADLPAPATRLIVEAGRIRQS
jgi:DNA replication and repair protein RecF